MKHLALIAAVAFGVAMLLVAHHVRRVDGVVEQRYRLLDIVREITKAGDDVYTPKALALIVLFLIAPVWLFFPAWFVLLIGYLPRPQSPGAFTALFVIQGIVTIGMALVIALLMMVSVINLLGGSPMGKATVFFYLIPLVLLVLGAWCIAIGFSPTLARMTYGWLR